jgi:hypothetical protein
MPEAKLINILESPVDSVDEGLRYVHDELKHGRCGLYVGTGPGGFAVIAGHIKVATMAGGVVIGLPLNRSQLEMLRDRCDELLAAPGGVS